MARKKNRPKRRRRIAMFNLTYPTKPPTRPMAPVKWFGGKGNFLPKLLPLIPYSRVYVEPFGGGGSVFFARKPSPVEVYNDLDCNLINLMRVIRNPETCAELERRLKLTLYARAEKALAWGLLKTKTYKNEIEQAWSFFVVVNQGFAAGVNSSWGFNKYKSDYGKAIDVNAFQKRLTLFSDWLNRLKDAQIDNQDAVKVMYNFDSAETVFYCDPPYLQATRKTKNDYAHEMTDEQHLIFLQACKAAQGAVVISGYDNELYRSELEGWELRTFDVTCAAAGRTRLSDLKGKGAGKEKQPRVECVWRNKRALELSGAVKTLF